MIQQFGLEGSPLPLSADLCRLRLADGPLEISWQHCSLTSDFLGDFFAGHADGGIDPREMRHSIGYLVNELLENAVKFRAPGDIEIEAGFHDSTFGISVQNRVDAGTARRFQALLAEITAGDPGELLIERIERNAADPQSGGSGLGILTLMNDYGAHLGWKFLPDAEDGLYRLETYAALRLS
jgi:hypothetical protein